MNVRNQLKGRNEVGVFGIVLEGRRKKEDPGLVQAWNEAHHLLVKHSQTGGITQGQWKVLSDYKLSGLKSSHVKQVLANLLVSTESGPPVHPSTASGKDYVTAEQRIPPQRWNMHLAVLSCFSRELDMLGERGILDKELMLAYDVEENIQRALVSYSQHTKHLLTRDFVMEAPLKFLHAVSHLIRSKWDTITKLEGKQGNECKNHQGSRELNGSKK